MKKKTKSKTKTKSSKQSVKKSVSVKRESVDLGAMMVKMMEKLESLERKIEAVMPQTSSRSMLQSSEIRVESRDFSKPSPEIQPRQDSSAQGPSANRKEKPLYQAVCADCRIDCTIPFKPTGERPVYCKECYAKRKAGNRPSKGDRHAQAPQPPPQVQHRQLKVIPNGVGKVTISEVIPSFNGNRPPGRNRPRFEKRPR